MFSTTVSCRNCSLDNNSSVHEKIDIRETTYAKWHSSILDIMGNQPNTHHHLVGSSAKQKRLPILAKKAETRKELYRYSYIFNNPSTSYLQL